MTMKPFCIYCRSSDHNTPDCLRAAVVETRKIVVTPSGKCPTCGRLPLRGDPKRRDYMRDYMRNRRKTKRSAFVSSVNDGPKP